MVGIDIQSLFADIIQSPGQRRQSLTAQGMQQSQAATGALSGRSQIFAPLVGAMAQHAPERREMMERSVGGLFGNDTRNESEKLQQVMQGADTKTPEGQAAMLQGLRDIGMSDKAVQLEQMFAAQAAAEEERTFNRSAKERGLTVQEAAETRLQTQADVAQRVAQATAARAETEREDARTANMAIVNAATDITAAQRATLETIATRSSGITPTQISQLVVERFGGTLGKVEGSDKVTNQNALINGEPGIVSSRPNGEMFVVSQNEDGTLVEETIDPQTVVLQGAASVSSSGGRSPAATEALVNILNASNIPKEEDRQLLEELVRSDPNGVTIPQLRQYVEEFGGNGATVSEAPTEFGTGVGGGTLNAFVDLPGPIMDGTASRRDEDVFMTAVTDYQQPSTSIDNLGNRVTTQKQLPPHVQEAYNEIRRRRAAPSNAAAAAATVDPEEALMSVSERAQVFMEGGDVPAVPGQMAINILSGNVTGPMNAVSRTLALIPGQPFGTFNEPVNAKGFHDLLSLRVLRVFQESPRFAERERENIQSLIDTANRFWDDPQRLIGAMIGIDQALSEVERTYEEVLKGEDQLVPRESYEQAAAALTSIKAYREFALPPRFTNNPADLRRMEEFAQNKPPGTMLLTQNRRGQWRIGEVE